jgi:hypothetical protein
LPTTSDHNNQYSQFGDDYVTGIPNLSHLSFKESLISREQDKSLQQVIDRSIATVGEERKRRYCLEDFIFIKVLGKGSFGKVRYIYFFYIN